MLYLIKPYECICPNNRWQSSGVTQINNTVMISDDGPNPDDNRSSDDTGVLLNPAVGIKIDEIDPANPSLIHWTFW